MKPEPTKRPHVWAALMAGIVGIRYSLIDTVESGNSYPGEGLVKMATVYLLVFAMLSLVSSARKLVTKVKPEASEDPKPDSKGLTRERIELIVTSGRRPIEVMDGDGNVSIEIIGLHDPAPANILREFVNVRPPATPDPDPAPEPDVIAAADGTEVEIL